MLNAVLQHHLNQQNTPVSRDMQSNLYVDNIITGCYTKGAAIDYYKEARAIMSSAQFNLCSWPYNSIAPKASAVQDNTVDDHSTVNILGLR